MPRFPEERAALAEKWRSFNSKKKAAPKGVAPAAPVVYSPHAAFRLSEPQEFTRKDMQERARIDALLDAAPVGPDSYKEVHECGAWYRRYCGEELNAGIVSV